MSIKGWRLQQGPHALKVAGVEDAFVTVNPAGKDRNGIDVLPKSAYSLRAVADAISAVSYSEQTGLYTITIAGHEAKKHMFVRFMTGLNEGIETPIFAVPTANTIQIYKGKGTNPHLDTVVIGDEVKILNWVTPASDQDGNMVFSPGPTQFILDGVATQVTEDTAVPANNTPLPVKLTGVTGDINITAQDLNIQSSHIGANADSMRIGDGTTEWGIEAVTKKGLVKDEDAATGLASLLTELQLKADLAETQPVSVASLPLPTGAATEATLEAARVLIASLAGEDFATEVTLEAARVLLASIAAEDFATETTLEAARVLLASIAAEDFATETTLAALASIDFSTEAKQDTIITALGLLATEATLAALSAKLPATLGQKAMAASLAVVLASDQSSIPVTGPLTDAELRATPVPVSGTITSTPSTLSGTPSSAQVTVGITAVRATVSGAAPNAARKRLMVKPSTANTGKIYIGGSTVTTVNGMEIIGPDRLEFELDASEYYLISDTAAQVVEVVEVV